MNYQIAVIPGDGIGPEVIDQAVNVLKKVGEKYQHTFQFETVLAGGAAIDAYGECLPQSTIDVCKKSDAVLLGSVGGWTVSYTHLDVYKRQVLRRPKLMLSDVGNENRVLLHHVTDFFYQLSGVDTIRLLF